MKDSNIESFVSSTTFIDSIASQFKEELDLNANKVYNKPSYEEEIRKIVRMWNTDIGRTWRQVTRGQQRGRLFILEDEDKPWIRIERSIGKFNTYFEKHSKVFKFDHTFPRE